MESKIKEVEEYFKQKIVEGEYKVVDRTQYVVNILVDNKYTFNLWVASSYQNFEPYNEFDSENFMYLHFKLKEKGEAWHNLEKLHQEKVEDKRGRLEKEKQEIEDQLNKLCKS